MKSKWKREVYVFSSHGINRTYMILNTKENKQCTMDTKLSYIRKILEIICKRIRSFDRKNY